ncbi:aldose epimerase family protein [Notoacmeibacter sp. MSK16QG-6]|uniref:aldose epimerase family protein n=1 Tax=Notoacmeibacter sp. MSK16QG-6 TaxID=2957982 RepID=UPI00209DC376|nr:aldose epimerase family protein [Notoacmeibacter sp. MSK16QG-6]MCP1199929.1 galactose mutarotase [Notoacmeibacter sp. MSK16QG-6]
MALSIVGTDKDGRPIQAIDIASAVLNARILTFGAALQDLRMAGVAHPLVLGLSDPGDYLANPSYLGAIVGRVANRIAMGRAIIGGHTYELDKNEEGRTTLHGGKNGTSHRNWTVVEHDTSSVELRDVLPDGHMGFPGRLTVDTTYRIVDDAISVAIIAQCDRATFCSFAPHFYFNLDGRADIADHRLQIEADHFIPVDDRLWPISGPEPVDGTPFDFRIAKPVPPSIDHHLCLSPEVTELRPIAILQASKLRLDLHSTEPGLQIYGGAGLAIEGLGLNGRDYGSNSGIALEPHRWIDAPNWPWRRQAELRPGERYEARHTFRFETA